MASMFSLEGKNAAVVGGASGIGEAVAIAFAEHGASVLCLDVDITGALDTATTITDMGGEADAGQLNILDGEAVTAAFESFNTKKGSLDIVVCTPGVNVRKPILDYTDEEIDRVLGVNLKGNAHVIQSAGRIMASQGSGSIILFSSIRSVVVEPGQSMYAATKAGIVQMVRTAAAELGPLGVRVNAIAPGIILWPEKDQVDKEIREQIINKTALGRIGDPIDIAAAAYLLYKSTYITGQVLKVDGGRSLL